MRVLAFQEHAFWYNFDEHHQISTLWTCTKGSYPAGLLCRRHHYILGQHQAWGKHAAFCCVLLSFRMFVGCSVWVMQDAVLQRTVVTNNESFNQWVLQSFLQFVTPWSLWTLQVLISICDFEIALDKLARSTKLCRTNRAATSPLLCCCLIQTLGHLPFSLPQVTEHERGGVCVR